MDFASQSIGFKSVINARELGGYVLPDGSRIKKGLLLRGGALSSISDEESLLLREKFHLAKVFDFRTSMEVRQAADKEIPGTVNIWMPAFNEKSQALQELSLPQEAYRDLGNWLVVNACQKKVQEVARSMYMGMAVDEFTQMQYAGFLQNIINTPSGAVYWHCSQGKDRTGFGAAMILAALGADRKLIIDDFLISNEFYKDDVDHFCSLVKTEEERAVIRTFIGVNPKYFSYALDWIDNTFGSIRNYLTGPLCLSQNELDILRNRYTE